MSLEVKQHMVPLYHLELVRERDIKYHKVLTVEAAAEIFHEMLDSSPVEKLAVLHVGSDTRLIGAEIVSIGGMEAVKTLPTEVFRGAIVNAAPAIWIAHNHVSGDTTPSEPDYRFTDMVAKAGEMVGIYVEDHLVIADGKHWSIRSHPKELGEAMARFDRAALIASLGGLFGGGGLGFPPPKKLGF